MAKKKAKDTERGPEFKRKLPVELTEAEMAERGKELGAALDDIEEIELELKEERDAANTKRKALLERTKELRKQTRTGQEDRDVPCQEVKDLSKNALTVIRLDSGVVIDTRALSLEERQGNFVFRAGQGPAENPGDEDGNDDG